MWRARVWILPLLLGVWASGVGASDRETEVRMPVVELDMLAFEDRTHFDAVYQQLTTEQAAADEVVTPGEDFREHGVFLDFAADLEFESLLSHIESVEAAIDAGREDVEGIYDPTEPSNHFIPSPRFRAVLNPQSEILVGSTFYRYHPHGYHQIANRDLDALARLRRGEKIDDHPNVTFNAYSISHQGCCVKNDVISRYDVYRWGTRRLKSTIWVTNSGLTYEIGVSTQNQRKKNNGAWIRMKADTIGHYGSSRGAHHGCNTFGEHNGYNKERHNRRQIDDYDSPYNNIDYFVKDYFSTHHYAETGSSRASRTLTMCVCDPAVPSFTLPQTATVSSSIVLDGSASEHESLYTIIARQEGTTRSHQWWGNGEIGEIDLAAEFNFTDPGGNGTNYTVTLAVSNGCTTLEEMTRTITIYGSATEVTYRAHVKKLGWMRWVWDGSTAGTTKVNQRMEAVEIKLANQPSDMKICYQAYVRGPGWQPGVSCDGQTAGTTGQSRRMERVKIWLENQPDGCSVEYQVFIGNSWQDWVSDGEVAYLEAGPIALKALRVRLVECP